MGLRMTASQQRTVELLEKLGSDVGRGAQDGSSVRMPVPFQKTEHTNIEVFSNGDWHDYSANKGWKELGLDYFGHLSDLELAMGDRFSKIWNGLERLREEANDYAEKRMLTADLLRESWVNDMNVLCFPMYSLDNGFRIISGIQRRFIQEHTPKNLAWHGSDAKNGFFYQPAPGEHTNRTVYVCEGATDTYTDFLPSDAWAVGAISCSTLDGLIAYLKTVPQDIHAVLCFDADEPGQEAQNRVYVAIKDRFETIEVMEHSPGLKDLNDEWCSRGGIRVTKIDKKTVDHPLFVTLVDELPTMIDSERRENVNFVGFFPPDFPDDYHTAYPDPKATIYIFPESYGRAEVNKLMWKLKKSAYILRGW